MFSSMLRGASRFCRTRAGCFTPAQRDALDAGKQVSKLAPRRRAARTARA